MEQILKPELVTRLRSLDLQARFVVEGYLAGLHKSPYHGFSTEFSEYRPYISGESIRHLDWKKYAKSDRFVVRQYEDNTNLKACLFLDSSASMAFGSNPSFNKFEYGRLLAASLSYLLIHQRDAVGLAFMQGETRQFLAPKATSSHLLQLLLLLQHSKPQGKADLAGLAHGLGDKMGRRGLMVIISDLLEPVDTLLNAVKRLCYSGHEVIVFHLQDPLEMKFDFNQAFLFEDMETMDQLLLDPRKIQKAYKREYQNRCSVLRKGFLEQRAEYFSVDITDSFERALTAFIQKRRSFR